MRNFPMDFDVFDCAQRKLAVLVVVLSLAVFSAAQAEHCVPVPAAAPTVDGILTGAGIAPSGGGTGHGTCAADPGWAGVVADNVPVVTMPDTQGVNLFLAGHSGGANLDKLFVGVHVQITPNLSTNDHVTLYFHFGAGGAFAAPDFALTYDLGAAPMTPDATPTDSECSVDAARISYYTFSGGNWVAQNVFSGGAWSSPGAVPDGKIISKKSWDFNPADDTETGIWELELSIDLNGLGITVPSTGTGVAVGTKVYLHDSFLNADTTYYYPQMLTNVNTDSFPASQGNVTSPASLQALNIGSCSNDVMVTSIASTDAHGNPDDFTLPQFDGGGNTTTPNHFTAKVKFFNPANALDSSPVGTANTGQVRFHIMPWNAGFTGDYLMATPTASFVRLNQEVTIPDFVWPQTLTQWNDPQGNPNPPSATLPGASHPCLKVEASGFNVNVVDANDVMQKNLTFTSASTIQDSFLVSNQVTRQTEERRPPYDKLGFVNYVLRVNWRNIGTNPGWKYEFPKAGTIKLKRLGRGYYLLRLKRGEARRVPIAITGGLMPGAVKQLSIEATAGGTLLAPASGTPPLVIPVKPDSVLSIVTRGLIRVSRSETTRPNDANGFAVRQEFATVAAKAPEVKALDYLLKDGYYRSSDHRGALIGSFDDFRTAFVVGTESTFLVPPGATKLYLAINDQAGQYKDNTGTFEVNVHFGEPIVLPTSLGQIADLKEGIPVQLPAGSNLPRLDIDVMQWDRVTKRLLASGYVSWAVYASHPGRP